MVAPATHARRVAGWHLSVMDKMQLISHRASSTAPADSAPSYLARALAFAVDGGAVPDWIQIFPAGPILNTVDGRSFRIDDPAAFVAAQNINPENPVLVDYDHLSSYSPDENGNQTAAGWIDQLDVRGGQVWARVQWTDRARQQIAAREWRFVSPEFRAHTKTGDVVVLDAVALVNRPAFSMTALAARQSPKGETEMEEIAKALGLPAAADQATILTAIKTAQDDLTAARASATTPPADKFVPRADYDTALARASRAETELADQAKAARDDEIDTVIAAAVTAGKIAPASVEHYKTLAAVSDEAFEQVKQICAGLPKVINTPDLDKTPALPGAGLTDMEKNMAAALGVSEEDFAKQKAASAA